MARGDLRSSIMGYPVQETQFELQSCDITDDEPEQLRMLQVENQKLREELSRTEKKYQDVREEAEDLQLELEIVKSQLARYQRMECAQLAQRRQAALAEHRRRYNLQHGLSVTPASFGRTECDGNDDDGDNEEGDFDIID